MEREQGARFKRELINKLLHFYFKDPKTKINSDAVLIMSEMLKIFVVEAAVRACKQATTEDLECVDIEHFEKILPQLVDFCPKLVLLLD
uniref:Centromere protein X n=1 Tax=Callorhinchus milii TaxID=7868 RepID=A0A4W3KJE5_CALMI